MVWFQPPYPRVESSHMKRREAAQDRRTFVARDLTWRASVEAARQASTPGKLHFGISIAAQEPAVAFESSSPVNTVTMAPKNANTKGMLMSGLLPYITT